MATSTRDKLTAGLVQTDNNIQRSLRLTHLTEEEAKTFSEELIKLRTRARAIRDVEDGELSSDEQTEIEQCMMAMNELAMRLMSATTPKSKR